MGVPAPLSFSVVIPTFNRAGYLARTIDSVLGQTYPHYEVIVVDDGSTDGTEAVVKKLESPRIQYHRKENGERAAARNFGTVRASGDYVTFLDSDDLLYPDYLQTAAEAIRTHASPPFLHLAYEVTDTRLNPKVKVDGLRSDDIGIFVKGNPLSCAGCFLRRDVAASFRFNEDRALSGSEDWELWIRVAAHFGLKTDNRVSAALIDHESRSVKSYPENKLRQRKELAMQYAFADPQVREKFGPHQHRIASYWDSYIALHLVLAGQNARGLRYFFSSLREYPGSLFERRSLGIAKHFVLNLLRPAR
jgi:glycosyltransferase involved in cell wall biosynthesis